MESSSRTSDGLDLLPSNEEEEMDVGFSEVEHKAKENLLNRVAHSNAFFKSQQRGEKDLTVEEKRKIAKELLNKNISLFLQRYWKFVNMEDLGFFEPYRNDYEVSFYLGEINKMLDGKKRKVRIKNRRYEALQKLVTEGSYFSDKEMKDRNPFLYEQLVGRHLTAKEKEAAQKIDLNNISFSTVLMEYMERDQVNCLRKRQQEEEEATFEEGESEDDEEYDDGLSQNVELSDPERQMLRNEFTNIMYESFLAGKDVDFDYSTVDDNVEYDSVHQREIDEEEKYFDEDAPEEETPKN